MQLPILDPTPWRLSRLSLTTALGSALAAGQALAQQPCQPELQATLGLAPSAFGGIQALASFDDGSGPALYAGGFFDQLPGSQLPAGALRYLARWDGLTWGQVGSGIGGPVAALTTYQLGGTALLVIGGYFTSGSGAPSDYLAAWDGQAWSPALGEANGPVLALATGQLTVGGPLELFAGGSFNGIGGVPAGRIARFAGSGWANIPGLPGPGPEGAEVLAIAAVPTGFGNQTLYVGGQFEHGLRRLASTTWQPVGFQTGFNNTVYDLDPIQVAPGVWSLFVGGAFTHIGGLAMPRAAEWTGSQWLQLPEGGFNGTVRAIGGVAAGGGLRVIAAGDFTASNAGTPLEGVALLEAGAWSELPGFDRPPQFVDFGFDPFGGGVALMVAGDFTSSTQGDSFLTRFRSCPSGFQDLPGCFDNAADLRPVSGQLAVGEPLLLRLDGLPAGPGVALCFAGASGLDGLGCGLLLAGAGELLLAAAPEPLLLSDVGSPFGLATFAIGVPNNPALVGQTIALQAAHVALTVGTPIQFSDGLSAVFQP